MRRLRIAEFTQLCLTWDDEKCVERHWERLPEATRAAVLLLLARLIARGVLVEEGDDG